MSTSVGVLCDCRQSEVCPAGRMSASVKFPGCWPQSCASPLPCSENFELASHCRRLELRAASTCSKHSWRISCNKKQCYYSDAISGLPQNPEVKKSQKNKFHGHWYRKVKNERNFLSSLQLPELFIIVFHGAWVWKLFLTMKSQNERLRCAK